MTGDQVINILIKVKGIGQWTINNYRIFALQDVDAWPSADLALQESTKLIKKINLRPNRKKWKKLLKMETLSRCCSSFFMAFL